MALVPAGGAAPAEPAEVPRELLNGEEEAGKNWRSCRHLPVFFGFSLRRDKSITPRLSFCERVLLEIFEVLAGLVGTLRKLICWQTASSPICQYMPTTWSLLVSGRVGPSVGWIQSCRSQAQQR